MVSAALVGCPTETTSGDGGADAGRSPEAGAVDASALEDARDVRDGSLEGDASTDAAFSTDAGIPSAGVPVIFTRTESGMPSIIMGGVNLLGGTGAYYIIGSCTGADDPGQNVVSIGATGGVLHAPGTCPGAPYRITTTLTSPQSVHVSIEIGPLPADYRTLSVPLDARRSLFTTLRASSSSYEVGCGLSWTPQSGEELRFDAVPTPCEIPGFGSVGAARFVPVPAWGEITGPYGTIRRTFASGDGRELNFYNHPGTHNIELSFSSDLSTVLAAGTTVHLEEDIVITAPPEGFPTRAEILLPLVYRGVLGREPDASGTATNGPRVQEAGAVGMEEVAAAMLASPEYATLRASRTSTEIVDQLYRGFLGRTADPGGLATFVPAVDGGRTIEVVHGLLASDEFRSAFPLAY